VTLAISNVAASAVAAVSEPVTHRMGLFMSGDLLSADALDRFGQPASQRLCRCRLQAGSDRCVLMVRSVTVITRHTDSAIASDAATA
jgi:hypothetical protein